MSDTATEASIPDTSSIASEPADDHMYRFLAIIFLVGIPILILFFIVMITLLAAAS